MRLADLISWLEQRDPNIVVPCGFHYPHSYRGYYDELAFQPKANTTVGEMLQCARSALGKTFTGYKGGEYRMKDYTGVHLAYYGHEGEGIGPVLLSYMIGDPIIPVSDD